MTDDLSPCIIFKPIETIGGLERYVAELSVTIDAPIYTPLQTEALPEPSDGCPEVREFRDSGGIRGLFEGLPVGAVIDALEYEQFRIPPEYNVVISIGEATKAVIHHPHQTRIHLLNMPPRWLYDLGPGRYNESWEPIQWLKSFYQSLIRVHDSTTISRIDSFVVPSETIKRRLHSYYNREAEAVIYPPVNTSQYRFSSNGDYLLYLGRLDRAKRVREIIKAVSSTGHQLKIAGTGPEEEELRRLAGPDVEMLGYVSEPRKQELLANCDALVFNSDREAFGIVPIEAMASGKPVVGVNEGYTRHQIVEGETGVLFERGIENLATAIREVTETGWDPERIQREALQYDVNEFREQWRSFLSELTSAEQAPGLDQSEDGGY